MEYLIPSLLLNLLIISIIFSVILMSLIQKFKSLSIINKSSQIWVLNLVFSFLLGIPFGMLFYNLAFNESIWVSIFSFIGAPSLYKTLKKQNIFTLRSLKDKKNNFN